MSSPGRRRREGYYAFSGHRHEADMLCPYKNESAKKDWMEGWNEAADAHEQRLAAEPDELPALEDNKWRTLCLEWLKGCTVANCDRQGPPYLCQECTGAFYNAITKLKEEEDGRSEP